MTGLPNLRITFACVVALLLLGPAQAGADSVPASLSIAAGQYGMRNDTPHAVGIELQLRAPFRWNLIRPLAGILTSANGGAYLYSGFAIEVPLPAGFELDPGLAAGVVLAQGRGDLGSPVEFRSSIELAFSPVKSVQLGVTFSHISNAKLARRNPGVELLMFSVAFPFPVGN